VLTGHALPFETIQAPPSQVTIIHELKHQVRVVALDKPIPTVKEQEVFPIYNGHLVDHFEGDTQVVYTVGFNEKTFVDATGAPHTDEMTTMERIRRISPTELEDVITIRDPNITAGIGGRASFTNCEMIFALKTTSAANPTATWRRWRAFAARDARLTGSGSLARNSGADGQKGGTSDRYDVEDVKAMSAKTSRKQLSLEQFFIVFP
jgi:hypothetical protein